jgi:citrate lyase subunit beta/citryl-CoA lyase
MAEPRLRRSMLMTPGNRLERLRRAATFGADSLVFDLEDGVPPAAKAQARQTVVQVLRELEPDGRERCVRINGLDTPYGADDLTALPLDSIDSIMLPKVESPQVVLEVQRRLEAMGAGRTRSVELIATLETPRGVLRALEIAEATPRISALFFGSGDYTAATGGTLSEAALLFPRSTIAAAAGAARIQAIDAAYFQDVLNAPATRRDALAARELGFVGKVVFHPEQVAVSNEVFSPTAEEIGRARRIVDAYREALERGHGTALANGVFVAVDLVAPAERLLHIAELVTKRDRPKDRPIG